ncbi:hypothetical protein ACFYE9_06990 [Rhizobium leguminosarum]|uniref:Uncharacterized protein n=1 Tax=Rhizobium leguminosarum TaxID=384 RepID=A0ACD5F4A4_RHILE|nr:hypothetical protein [Rhizobium leguminosarum]
MPESTTRGSKRLIDISPFKLRSSRATYKPLKDKTNDNALTPEGDHSIFLFQWHMPRKRGQALPEKRANKD